MKKSVMKSNWRLVTAYLFVLALGITFTCWGDELQNVKDDSPFGFIQSGYDTKYEIGGFALVAELGVHWNKPFQKEAGVGWEAIEPKGNGIYDFSALDKTIKDAAQYHVNPYLVLNAFNHKYGVIKDNAYPEKDSAKWKAKLKDYVKAVVERYDADGYMDLDEDSDGVQDVPKMKYWGVGHNEIDGPNYTYWHTRISQYVDLVITQYDAIKEACPTCLAVLGGASRSETSFNDGGVHYKIITELNVRCPDIVIDYHWWGAPFETKEGWAYKEHKTIIDKICDLRMKHTGVKPEIWTTEGGTYSDFNGATERQQAADVIKRYVYSLANKQTKLFWTRVVEYDWTENDRSWLDYTGLINNPENSDNKNFRKLSYYTYKKLVEAFTDADWRNIQPVIEDDKKHIYMYKAPRHTRGALFIVWNDNIIPTEVTFSGLASTQAKITEAIPPYNSGDDIDNYTNTFKSTTMKTSDGNLTISVGDSPLFIEEYKGNLRKVNGVRPRNAK